jgi:hypothetical protein
MKSQGLEPNVSQSKFPDSTSQKYAVVHPGHGIREFETSEEAVKYLVSHPGYKRLYGPDGNLIMTIGKSPSSIPPPN